MGRILGIDYGDSRVGLALSDPTKTIASPYQTITNENEERLLHKIKNSFIYLNNLNTAVEILLRPFRRPGAYYGQSLYFVL